MRRLAAVFHRDERPASADELRPMIEATGLGSPTTDEITTVGSFGIWIRPVVHQRAGSGARPFVEPDHGVIVGLDGRIDNTRELASDLVRSGVRLRTASAEEIIAGAYTTWGSRCFERTFGDFAVVLWDPNLRRLICARDGLGLKPLYYTSVGTTFMCASELRQLVVAPGVSVEPNEGMVAEYLADAITNVDETLYRDLYRVPPAHTMEVNSERTIVRRSWTIEPGPELRLDDDREYQARLKDLLTKAVRSRVPDVGVVASQLSGGLDSTLVSSLLHREFGARDNRAEDLGLYAMVYPDHPEADEREWIARVSSWLALRPNLANPRALEDADFSCAARAFRDLPPYPGDLECDGMMERASTAGSRVMFTGNGGDEWFWGSAGFGPESLRGLIGASGSAGRRRELRALLGALARAVVPPGLVRSARRMRRRSWPWLPAEFSRRNDLVDRITPAERSDLEPGSPRASIAAKLSDGSLIHGREMAERYAASWGIEERHPLHDRRVIEFAASLPSDQLYRDGMHRFLLRGASIGLIPDEVRTRTTKAEFSHVVVEALLRPEVSRRLKSLAISELGWVRADRVATMLNELETLARQDTVRYTEHAWPLWMVYGIETWFRAVFV